MDFDPRLTNLGIGVTVNPNATWSLTSAQYQDETQAGGNHHIYFTVLDAAGKQTGGVKCIVDWVGRDPGDKPTVTLSDPTNPVNFPMYANLDITLKNGPYFAFIEDQSKSDVVTGMGLPEHHHVNFLLTFAKSSGGTPPPTPPPPQATLEQAVIAAAQKYTWMPINTDGALYKFAMTNNLGYPQTDEFEFAFGSDTFVGQVYNLGIVYVKKGDWGNCKWVKKP
ncbi:MAG: hypothetical protein KGJ80_04850 [Chloroflexota bacterium]|nr:hypothetical protein [Chloroflexota bacterium]